MKIGFGKTKIQAFHPEVGMLGYGKPGNVIRGEMTPLYARSMVIWDSEIVVLCLVELCFVTIALKQAVIDKLSQLYPEKNIGHANLLLSANHTHSGPGGFSKYPFYNFSVPGFKPRVFDCIVGAIVESIVQAFRTEAERTIVYGETTISADREIAFNRSISAYANNPEHRGINLKSTELAVDRKMRALLVRNSDGSTAGMLNLFGVHCTSVSNQNTLLHHDNKGIAAETWEKSHPGAVAFFAQSSAGDVSPNYVWDKKLKRTRGKFSDQYESAAYNGEAQFHASQEIVFDRTLKTDSIRCSLNFLNMKLLAAAPAHGIGFAKGTLEGPAVPAVMAKVLETVSLATQKIKIWWNPQWNKSFYEAHGNKRILMDHRDGSILGIPLVLLKNILYVPDPILNEILKQARRGDLNRGPLVPEIVPIQLIRLGELILVGMPGEITTTAAARLISSLRSIFPKEKLLLWSYANAYMGYVTTPEEYDLQCYEGGHTIYGRNTLAAFTDGFLELARNVNQQ